MSASSGVPLSPALAVTWKEYLSSASPARLLKLSVVQNELVAAVEIAPKGDDVADWALFLAPGVVERTEAAYYIYR